MRSPLKAHLFVLAANIIYGINYSVGKVALSALPPFGIVLLRVTGALIIFSVLHRLTGNEKTDRADHKKLLLASVFGVALNQLLFFTGLSLTSEIHSALIMITTPLIVLIMAWIILKERITFLKLSGIAIGAAGVALLITSGVRDASSPANWTGDIFIMLNATSYAIFLIIAKPLMRKYSPYTLAKWIFIYGFFMVLPFGIRDVSHIQWQQLSGAVIGALIYVVAGATVLAYLFNILGLNLGSPALVSIYIYTQPVIASLIAVIAGNDQLTWMKVISALMVFGGVALVSFTPAPVSLKQRV